MIILHVDSSILGPDSASHQISAEVLAAETARNPDATVRTLDLGVTPIGHLTGAHLAAAQGLAPEEPGLAEDVAAGQAALAGFLEADLVIVGAPMYNFGIPSQLKAWIDRLAIAGQTFRYTADGPEGLVGGKRVVIASARGGFYGPGAPSAAFDHQDPTSPRCSASSASPTSRSFARKDWPSAPMPARPRLRQRAFRSSNRRRSPWN